MDELSNTAVVQQEDLFGPPVSKDFSQHPDPFENIDQLVGQEKKSKSFKNKETALNPAEKEAMDGWSKNKKVSSKFEDSLSRNGIGLLILSAGLSLLPFVANSVEELKSFLFLAPMIAAGLAFVASFVLAYSLRRSNIGMVLVSGLPFILIGMIALGGHYYLKANSEVTSTNTNDGDQQKNCRIGTRKRPFHNRS